MAYIINKVLHARISLVFIFLSFTAFQLLYAQTTGSIKGKVFDSETGDPLPSANLIIKNTSLGTAADFDGNYYIRSIPAGKYELIARYVGYEEKTINIAIIENRTLNEDIGLEFKSIEGETIIVTAQAESQIQAINQQLSSNTISNVVSESRIKELPDVNAAESIGRLPGVSIQRSGGEATKVSIRGLSPKYNTVTVNGVKLPATGDWDRSVDLSLISSNMLDGIELKKAITPDMDADAFGGSVDLKIKEAPDEFHFDLSAQGGYTQLQSYYGNYSFTGSVSHRFLDGDLGVIASFNLDNYDRSADKFSANYRQSSKAITGENIIIISGLGLREETVRRGRTGGSLVLDYKIPSGKVTLNGFYNNLHYDGLYRINDIDVDWNRHYYDLEKRKGNTSIFTGALGIEQDFDWIKYDFSVARTNSYSKNPEDFRWRFGQEGNVFSSLPDENTHPTEIQSMLVIDTLAALQNIWVDATEREENVSSTQLNIQLPFRISQQITGTIKTGAKFRWLDRFNDQEQQGRAGLQYGSGAGNLSEPFEQIAEQLPSWNLDEVIGDVGFLPIGLVMQNYDRDDFLEGDYDLGFVYDEEKMLVITRALQRTYDVYGSESAYRNNAIGSRGRDYDGTERYQAGYVMAQLNLGSSITFTPGIRWEGDYSKYNGQRYREIISAWEDQEPGDLDSLTVVRTNDFWLPMFHLKWQPLDWLQVRLAQTKTLTRPDYMQYAPITSIDGFRSTVVAANSKLKPALSSNYDLSVSVYQNYVGLFTVSGFYKSIDDLIISVSYKLHPEVSQLPGLNIPTEWYVKDRPTVYTHINNPFEANYKGFEIDWQTHFWYLPSFLQGLVLNVNYTYIESETTYQGYFLAKGDSLIRERPPVYNTILRTDSVRIGRMPDQPTHIANITIGYDFKGFSARLSFLYQTDMSTFVHATNSLFDTFSGDYARLDLTLKQKIGDNLEVFSNFNNLNSRPDRNFRGSVNSNPSYTEYYGFTMDLGVRYRL
ncbi:MAG: TonB-dependent receptor [Melioribacteraceae bacterium]|nr:TonB-dependent receptor [Melioribacteraceae bacterium]